MTPYSFPPTSRHHAIETASRTDEDGRVQVYLRRRFLPQTGRFALLQEHVVTEHERPDNIAHQHLGDAEAWWRLCDANGVLHPLELITPIGKRLRITLPEGIPGPAAST